MSPLGRFLPLFLSFHCVSANWRREHAVTGLPILDGQDLTSYAGLVTVRKDHVEKIEVPRRAITDLKERAILLAFRS